MSLLANAFTLLAVGGGLLFYLAGTMGLLRLPDPLSRLHALTKADNLGLGLIVLGLLPQTGDIFTAGKLIALWLLMQLCAGTVAQLLADALNRAPEEEP